MSPAPEQRALGWDGDGVGAAPGTERESGTAEDGEGSGKGSAVMAMQPYGYPVAPSPAAFGCHPPHGFFPPSQAYLGPGQWDEMQWRFHQERVQMAQVLQQMQEENLRLKIQLMEERKTKYTTPPEGTPAEASKIPAVIRSSQGRKPR